MGSGRLARLGSGVPPDPDERRARRPARGERDARSPQITYVGLVVALAVAAIFVPGSVLELQRGNFEPWRILTCHLTHFSYEQLAWDALAFASLAAACGTSARSTRRCSPARC